MLQVDNQDLARYPAHLLFSPENPDCSAARLAAMDSFIQKATGAVDSLKRIRNGLVFACRFPPEILCNIFEFAKLNMGWPRLRATQRCAPDGSHITETSYDKYWMTSGWAAVTHVCALWRRVAIGSPGLWKNPHDFFALPPSLSLPVLQRAQTLPFHLDLSAFSLRRLKRAGGRILLPGAAIPIVELRMLLFRIRTFRFFEEYYFPCGSFHQLRHLYISIDLNDDDSPVLLPIPLDSNSTMTELELDNCLPSRWDAPMFGSHLTRLALSYAWDRDIAYLMPSGLDFASILTSVTSLEILDLNNVFPVIDPTSVYPQMIMPPGLRSIDICSWDNSSRHRDCLVFLAHVILRRRDAHIDVSLGEPMDGSTVDDDIAQTLLTLISSAVYNLCRQQSHHKHLILGDHGFLTHSADASQSPERLWPISVMHHMFANVHSALNFHFDLECVLDAAYWHEGSVPISLRGIQTISLEHMASSAYLESAIWWRALRDASDVHRVSIFVGECEMLLPRLAERVSGDNGASFSIFPHLKTIHVHIEDPFTVDDFQLDDKEDACAGSLAVLQSLVQSRMHFGSPLDCLMVDVAMSGWAMWGTIRDDVEVKFCEFHSDDRDRSSSCRPTWHILPTPY